jgi:hypothetical protein
LRRDSPQVSNAIGATIAATRAEDANTLSVIDATKYPDPNAAPDAPSNGAGLQ